MEPATSDRLRLLVVGDVMLDVYLHLARVKPNPEIGGGDVHRIVRRELRPGGAAAVAAIAAGLGAEVHLAGAVGDGPARYDLANLLVEAGVSSFTAAIGDNALTTEKWRRVLDGRLLADRLDFETPCDVEAGMLSARIEQLDYAVIVVCDHGKGVVSSELLDRLRVRFPRAALFVDPATGRDWEAYGRVRLIKATLEEWRAQAKGDGETLLDLAWLFARVRLCDLVLTDGPRGLWYLRGGELPRWRQATRCRSAIDPTGCGDTVLAALAVAQARGRPLRLAIEEAIALAAEQAESLGVVQVGRRNQEISNGWPPPIVSNWRRAGCRIVAANGCFDGLHRGHAALIDFARRQGDRLIVLLNSDTSVRRLKGPGRPLLDYAERRRALLAAGADLVLFFDEDTPRELIRALRPAVLVKGADVPRPWPGEEFAGECVGCPMVGGVSTTALGRRRKDDGVHESPGHRPESRR